MLSCTLNMTVSVIWRTLQKMFISACNIYIILHLNTCFKLHAPNYYLYACQDLTIPVIPGLIFILIYWENILLHFHDMAQEYCGE